ncbi:hypothetical protein BHE74_00010539 [Ensete ventricosum]|nr:hypothetical protein GW17_00011456 [Ensete ventricosum]RWW81091.1 hypothetical protein BHE74_00010539 [Ensete ventricosum]
MSGLPLLMTGSTDRSSPEAHKTNELTFSDDRSQMRRRREPGGCGGEEIGLSSLPIDGVTVLGDVAQQIADAEQRTSHSPIHVDLFVLAGVAAVTPF